MEETILSAEVTIKFKFEKICSDRDLFDANMSLTEMILWLLEEEGLSGFVDTGIGANYNVIKVEEYG